MGILVPGVQGLGVIGFGVVAGSRDAEERQGVGGIPVDPAQRGGDLRVPAKSRFVANGTRRKQPVDPPSQRKSQVGRQ